MKSETLLYVIIVMQVLIFCRGGAKTETKAHGACETGGASEATSQANFTQSSKTALVPKTTLSSKSTGASDGSVQSDGEPVSKAATAGQKGGSVPSEKAPAVSQESIDEALSRFGIVVPVGVRWPRVELDFPHRGALRLNGWWSDMEVVVGPAAFSSWSLLGSTLAHELEVHASGGKRKVVLIRVREFLLRQNALDEEEREAYAWEIKNKDRFGLSSAEVLNIKATMDYFFASSGERAPEDISAK